MAGMTVWASPSGAKMRSANSVPMSWPVTFDAMSPATTPLVLEHS